MFLKTVAFVWLVLFLIYNGGVAVRFSKDLESHGIKIKNSYTEDGELVVYVDESIFKEGK